ncbi:N-terminally processed] [Durusdinium trenchii]|uniref:N-terminally processed] n=1 Tax=Durusdinium trenchii TaxID=1381693 RepID=A0ABP0K940_9DINO
MGGNKGQSAVTYADMYGGGMDEFTLEEEFETVNPLAKLEEELISDTEEEDEELNAELEELPEGISGPKGMRSGPGHKAKKASKRSSKRRGLLGRLSTKRHSADRSSVRSGSVGDVTEHEADLLEDHEMLQDPDFVMDDDSDHLNNDDADDLVRRKPQGWLRAFLSSSTAGLGGGAMSWSVLLMLVAPALAINTMTNVSYVTVGQFLFVPALFYIYLSIPVFLGWVFAQSLRKLGPLNGFPFEVGSLSIYPWIKDYKLHARLVVQDASFGNPPGFPFESFLECRRVDMEGAIPFAHIRNLLLLRKEKVPLRKVPDFERFMKIDFNHVEVTDAMVNFQMFDGKFNINEFTRILADGEVLASLGRNEKPPNQLTVRIIRAKHLLPHRLKKTCDPYVVVRCRRQAQQTHTQTHTVNPMFNEELIFHQPDASVVMEIAVYDRDAPEGNQASLIGHWAMTTKYLATDPTFIWKYDQDFEAYTRRNRKDGAMGFKGWVPLATKKWKKMGVCGQLQVELLWKHVPEDEIVNRYHPKRRYTALEQLTQQSNEDQLRFGDWARFRDWLNHEPFCYDIRRFTVRGTRFYVQDLFRGHKGVPESLVLSQSNVDGADCVRIPFLEMRKQFRPKGNDEGITSYDAFVGFFIGLLTSAARSGRLGSAIAQILSGGVWNFGNKFRNLLRGEFDKALMPIRPESVMGVAKLAKSGMHVLHQNVRQNQRNRAQFKIAVEADDTDFLQTKVELSGHLDRYAVKFTSEEVSNATLANLAKKRGHFKTKYFELKGDTLFYRKHEKVPKGVTYNLTYKVDLSCVYSAVFVASYNELLLNVHEESHIVRLREPNLGKKTKDNTPLRKWIRALKKHDIPFEEFD